MATGFPVKANYATGDVLTAANMNDLSGTVNYLQYLPPRNAVLNSAMAVAQRGASFTIASATSTYTLDRWNAYRGATGMTVTQQNTSDTTNLPFIQKCMRVARDSGNTSTTAIQMAQSFETVNSIRFAGQSVTLSFYARAGANYSPTSAALAVYLQTGTGTDQNYYSGLTGATNIINGSTATLTTTWQRFTFTATVGATATQLAIAFVSNPVGTAGAADYYEITGVQLELGSTANTYMPNQSTYQGELAACQRYYFRWNSVATYSGTPFQGYSATNNSIQFAVNPPVTLRTTPSSIDFSSGLRWTEYKATFNDINALTIITGTEAASPNGFWCGASPVTGTPFTAGRVGNVTASNNASAYVGFSAEL